MKADNLHDICECQHVRGQHDESQCMGGEDTVCRCTSFVEPDDEAAEAEERRQYRAWRNDSGV